MLSNARIPVVAHSAYDCAFGGEDRGLRCRRDHRNSDTAPTTRRMDPSPARDWTTAVPVPGRPTSAARGPTVGGLACTAGTQVSGLPQNL